MGTLRSALILAVALSLGESLAVPREDAPETAYDESESLPYETTPLFAVVAPRVIVRGPTTQSHAALKGLASLIGVSTQRIEYLPHSIRLTSQLPISIVDHSLRC